MILTETRRDLYLPLSAIASVPTPAAQRLAGLGVTTLNELRDAWVYGDRAALVDYLGDSPARWFNAGTPVLMRPRGVGEATAASPTGDPLQPPPGERIVRHSRGLLLEKEPPAAPPPQPLPATAPRRAGKTVNLARHFPPVRDQGQRGTCVAFASVAVLEYHLYREQRDQAQHHAEQFVYWACKQGDGIANEEGTFIRIGRQVLSRSGSCLTKTWPYDPLPVARNESQHPPPEGAQREAKQYRFPGGRNLRTISAERLCRLLDAGRPVVLGVATFASWDFPSVQDSGEIPMPLPGARTDRGHAVCVVGYELREGVPGGGAFIFRNSWGQKWAHPSGRFGEGYGTLFFDYVRQYGSEAFA